MTVVQSSNVHSVGYDPKGQRLAILFKSGGKYTYSEVPQVTFNALIEAPSVGSFIAKTITGKFPVQKD